GSLAVSTVAGATTGTLNLAGANINATADSFSVNNLTTLASPTNYYTANISAKTGNALTLPGSFIGTLSAAGGINLTSTNAIKLANGANARLTSSSGTTLNTPVLTVGADNEFGGIKSTLNASWLTFRNPSVMINTNPSASSGLLVLNNG